MLTRGRRLPRSEAIGSVRRAVDVRLLGPLELIDGAWQVVGLAGERQRGLVALLALAAPKVVSTDRIVEALWSEETLRSPQNALHVAVSRIRKALGDNVLETAPGGYRLQIPVSSLDVERFRLHTQRGRQFLTLGHPAKAAESFRQALAQWRASALMDLRQFEFAEQASRQLEEERLRAVEWLMEAELGAGDHELVIGELSGLVEAFPFRERLWGHLMLALYRSGRQAEALRAFGRIKELLAEELGVEPVRELVDLEERILLHNPALEDQVGGQAPEWPEGAELVSFAPREIIVEEGAPADAVYWVEAGRVQIYKTTSEGGEEVLAELGPGRYFGELASLLGTGRTASVRASIPTTLSTHTVESFRRRLGVERAKDHADLPPPEAVRELMRRGEYLQAYDEASRLIERGVGEVEIRYLAVLALARSGATAQARRRFDNLALGSIDPVLTSPRLAEDIAALGPRLDKDMALNQSGEDRRQWARRSAEGYQAAFDRHGSAYLGVNAATMWLIAGDVDLAGSAARLALARLPGETTLGPQDLYWTSASEAEGALILGDFARAEQALDRAAAAGDRNEAARATTLRQLRLVCATLGIDPGLLRPLFNPTVVHFCGHRVVASGESGRFPPEEEGRVAADLRATFERLRAGIGFGSLAAGADLLAAEALLERGAELHVVLPFDREEFVRTSVAPAGADWVGRFERCLAQATGVLTATSGEFLDDPVLFDFCSRIAMGDALVRARFLETEAYQVAVWDGASTGDPAGTAVDVSHWKATERPSIVIPVGSGRAAQNGDGSTSKRRIRALVFADFAGFSKLSDAQLVVFQDVVMAGLARTVSSYESHLLSGRTWGDGLYLVFEDVVAAAECSLRLQETTQAMDYEGSGLHGLKGMRVACHAAPVFDGWDPIGGTRLFYGAGVTQTARIEPRTPEGEVYVTHPFASLALLASDRSFDCQYVGTLPTAKGYGSLPLFSLRRRS